MVKSEPRLPLTPAVFHILLALFGRERHGYEIMHWASVESAGAVSIEPGTMYGSRHRMIDTRLAAKSNRKDARKSYRKLTLLGQAKLRAEPERLLQPALCQLQTA
jgi:DNA-binding PadR family transcriptional regulator